MLARVVSYNILSDRLLGSHKPAKPEYLDATFRRAGIERKLEAEIENGAKEGVRPVICLQEISIHQQGDLQVFFAKHRYRLIASSYAKRFMGYMGTGIAFSDADYALGNCWIKAPAACAAERVTEAKAAAATAALEARLSKVNRERRAAGREPLTALPKDAGPSLLARIWRATFGRVFGAFTSAVRSRWGTALRRFQVLLGLPFPWEVANSRNNMIVTVELVPRAVGGQPFVVSTVHMPCLFGSLEKEQAQLAHLVWAAREAECRAAGKPYVLAGDFNMRVDSANYAFMTGGMDAVGREAIPSGDATVDFRPSEFAPMRSAYAVASGEGKEPQYTTYANGIFGPFIGTLDYIFVSKQWAVQKVGSIPVLEAAVPNENEPSDHLLISADLSL